MIEIPIPRYNKNFISFLITYIYRIIYDEYKKEVHKTVGMVLIKIQLVMQNVESFNIYTGIAAYVSYAPEMQKWSNSNGCGRYSFWTGSYI